MLVPNGDSGHSFHSFQSSIRSRVPFVSTVHCFQYFVVSKSSIVLLGRKWLLGLVLQQPPDLPPEIGGGLMALGRPTAAGRAGGRGESRTRRRPGRRR